MFPRCLCKGCSSVVVSVLSEEWCELCLCLIGVTSDCGEWSLGVHVDIPVGIAGCLANVSADASLSSSSLTDELGDVVDGSGETCYETEAASVAVIALELNGGPQQPPVFVYSMRLVMGNARGRAEKSAPPMRRTEACDIKLS